MSASQVINRIVSTAKDAGAPGKDPLYGFGVLNAEAALKADVAGDQGQPAGHHRRLDPRPPAREPGDCRRRADARAPDGGPPTLPEATVPVAVRVAAGQCPPGRRRAGLRRACFVAIIAGRALSSCGPGRTRAVRRRPRTEPDTGAETEASIRGGQQP